MHDGYRVHVVHINVIEIEELFDREAPGLSILETRYRLRLFLIEVLLEASRTNTWAPDSSS
jgi:PhoPQ-activated pathogenicity-related protein